MKKRVSALALALILIFSVSAAATTTRAVNLITVTPLVSASRSGVTCALTVSPRDSASKYSVSGTVTLSKDGEYVTSWTVDTLRFSKTHTPVSKGTYRMDYDITVKGPAGTDYLTGSKSDTY